MSYDADLYLPTGEISDTLLATMAKAGAEDGRPMVVFVFADCDPAGYQMAVSIGHKLRALKEAFSLALRSKFTPRPSRSSRSRAWTSFDAAEGNREARRRLARDATASSRPRSTHSPP